MKSALLIDGNFFTYRTVSIVETNKETNKKVSTKEDMGILMRKIAMDLCSQIRLFEGIFDTVIWTIDAKSWRKTYYPELNYKGNRVVDDTIVWDNVNKVRDEFLKILENKGVIVSRVSGAEGDDLIYAWNEKFKSMNKSTIILSGDKDLNQLVYLGEKSYCIQYSPITEKLYCENGFNDWLNKEDVVVNIFNFSKPDSNSEKLLLKDIINDKKLQVVEHDPIYFTYRKVLMGDAGDNVKSVFFYDKANKTGKVIKHKVSEAKASKIVDFYILENNSLSKDNLYDQDTQSTFAKITYEVMKAEGIMNESLIKQNFNSNVIMMVLDSRSIPTEVYNDIQSSIENTEKKHLNIKDMLSMKTLLDGTEYIDEDYIKVNASIFKGDKDDDDDMSFIKKKQTKLF